MNNESNQDKVWYLSITNDEEYECHGLSRAELQGMLQEQRDKEFNGIIIGRDVDCTGRLMLFFKAEKAYVAYEDFERNEWRCSYDLEACKRPDWNELIRLTPGDTHDFSFRKCSIIPKEQALRIVESYLESGKLDGLYLSDGSGKPVLDEK